MIKRLEKIKSSTTTVSCRNCRFSLIPKPFDPLVIRNFTSINPNSSRVEQIKTQLTKIEIVKDMMSVNFDPETINEINNDFKKALFAQWLTGNKKNLEIMKKKIKESLGKQTFKTKRIMENSKKNHDLIAEVIGSLITQTGTGDTSRSIVIPSRIREVLFDGWEQLGPDFIQILFPYAKSLDLDLSVYKNDVKYIFHPPVPSFKKVKENGFKYDNWSEALTFRHFYVN